MPILGFIKHDCVKVPLVSTDKSGAIRELVDLAYNCGEISDRDDVLEAVMAREAMMPTGIGHGVAAPHAKADSVTRLTGALGVTSQPMEFDSVDGEPVRLIILMVSPASENGPYVEALTHISRLFRNESFRERLIDAGSADELISVVQAEEGRGE